MTAIGRVIAGAGFGIGVALLLAACIGGPDCGAIQEILGRTRAPPLNASSSTWRIRSRNKASLST